MTDKEISVIKQKLIDFANLQIDMPKSKLQILRTYRTKTENSKDINEVKKLYDDVHQMLNLYGELFSANIDDMKNNIYQLLDSEIEVQKSKIQVLRMYQSKAGAATNEYELYDVHNSLAQYLGIKNTRSVG